MIVVSDSTPIISLEKIDMLDTLGVLLQAKKSGLIDNVKPMLDALISANIRISDSLYQAILERSGELR